MCRRFRLFWRDNKLGPQDRSDLLALVRPERVVEG